MLILVSLAAILSVSFTTAERSPYSWPHFVGDRSVIVQLFEWQFDEIAKECESFLGPNGYGGIQISPVLEYAKIEDPPRPWWERYQPVSYRIVSRSGNAKQLSFMVDRCNRAGVRVYVDLVINHMTGHSKGHGIGGTPYDGYTNNYPGVPYDPSAFNGPSRCTSSSGKIENWWDTNQVRNCELLGLRDLDQGQEHVRSKIAEAMNSLIDFGVAGFRIDSSKHMWPADMASIFERVHNLNPAYFPPNSRPFIFHEVNYVTGEGPKPKEYLHIGAVSEFRYRRKIVDVFRKYDNQKLKYLRNFGEEWDFVPRESAVPFVDNQDLQRTEAFTGINFREPKLLKMATAFMLAWPYGSPKIMSSYEWTINKDNPTTDDSSPPAHDQRRSIFSLKRHSDESCSKPWVCEHRWPLIRKMTQFRNIVENEPVKNWHSPTDNVIAFSRGSKGFIAIVNDDSVIDQGFQTGLPEGEYCDIISGDKKTDLISVPAGKVRVRIVRRDVCSGKNIIVGKDGIARININGTLEYPMVAIHIGSRT